MVETRHQRELLKTSTAANNWGSIVSPQNSFVKLCIILFMTITQCEITSLYNIIKCVCRWPLSKSNGRTVNKSCHRRYTDWYTVRTLLLDLVIYANFAKSVGSLI